MLSKVFFLVCRVSQAVPVSLLVLDWHSLHWSLSARSLLMIQIYDLYKILSSSFHLSKIGNMVKLFLGGMTFSQGRTRLLEAGCGQRRCEWHAEEQWSRGDAFLPPCFALSELLVMGVKWMWCGTDNGRFPAVVPHCMRCVCMWIHLEGVGSVGPCTLQKWIYRESIKRC